MITSFPPSRRGGALFHTAAMVLCLAGSVWMFNQATRTPVGMEFAGYLLGFIGLALPIPFLAYRLYSLLRGSYTIRSGSIRLVWGLRVEEIPLVDITWIRPLAYLDYPLPLPVLRWPGAWVGVRRIDRRHTVEFMAASRRGLLVIETARGAYAISPEDPAGFLHSFQRIAELGALDAPPGSSIRPGELVGSVWRSRFARWALVSALVLAAGFALWTVIALQPTPGVRYPLAGTSRFVNSTQLILMPVLNSVYFLIDLLLGLFFFRRPETRPLSYLLWITSSLASILFFLAVLMLLG